MFNCHLKPSACLTCRILSGRLFQCFGAVFLGGGLIKTRKIEADMEQLASTDRMVQRHASTSR